MEGLVKILAGIILVLGALALIAGVIAVSAIINGWVLTKLWHWFAVPIFGFHDLEIVQAIGIGLIVSFLTHKTVAMKKSGSDETDWAGIGANLLSPFVVLLVGYIVHLFM